MHSCCLCRKAMIEMLVVSHKSNSKPFERLHLREGTFRQPSSGKHDYSSRFYHWWRVGAKGVTWTPGNSQCGNAADHSAIRAGGRQPRLSTRGVLLFFKTLTFPSKKTPLLLSKHWHRMNGNTYFNLYFTILCLFRGSSNRRQQPRKPSHFRSHSASEPRIFRGL